MAIFQGVLFLVFGIGLLAVDSLSLSRGWLPCGSRGLSGRLAFHRDKQPRLFWLMFALYGIAGVVLTVFAIRVLVGDVAPLPLL